MLVETIFQYRTLIGKSELGCGLDWDEIETITEVEHAFVADRGKSGRRFRREAIELKGLLRGDCIHDRVDIVELAPGGLVCRNAPFITRGELIEIVIELGDGRSFRFHARGVWVSPDGDNFKVGLVFIGVPICLHQVQLSAPAINIVDQISAA